MKINRGDIYYADLSPHIGSEQGGIRPVLILQNNVGNVYSSTTIIAAITSLKAEKKKLPTHVKLKAELSGLVSDSIIECEQLRTIDTVRIKNKKLGTVDEATLIQVDETLKQSLGLKNKTYKEDKLDE